ncbi:cold shock domain-containing protein [Streptomyces sp. NBC_00335]|uniref:cold-shock protein n=1 Tax=unclassified Streptomyces TaxID=2593676 RepID=UPI00225A6FD2|nr:MULTISPECIES: cold shock domain-containing protein [unclassified Streptomyces]MCX5409648.1 cold shock domain-containing protein [Streptomyces sp. NBC_00086]
MNIDQRRTGVVVSYNRDRGYGFIRPYGDQSTLYVERRALEGWLPFLAEGQQVSFLVEFTHGRFTAERVLP